MFVSHNLGIVLSVERHLRAHRLRVLDQEHSRGHQSSLDTEGGSWSDRFDKIQREGAGQTGLTRYRGRELVRPV